MAVEKNTGTAGNSPNVSLSRVGISISADMMDSFDQIMETGGYSSRSEGIREALRYYIQHYEWINEVAGERIAVITIVYDPWQHGIVGRITGIERKFHCIIKSSFQWKLDSGDYLRILSLYGDAAMLRKVDERLMALKGVKSVRLTTIRPSKIGDTAIS